MIWHQAAEALYVPHCNGGKPISNIGEETYNPIIW